MGELIGISLSYYFVFTRDIMMLINTQFHIHHSRSRTSLCRPQLPLPRPTPPPRLSAVDRLPNPSQSPRASQATETASIYLSFLLFFFYFAPPRPLLPLLRNPLHPPPLRPRPALDLGLPNPQKPTQRPTPVRPDHPPNHRQRALPIPRERRLPRRQGRGLKALRGPLGRRG